MPQLDPSADAIRAFDELVHSTRVDGAGGDPSSRMVTAMTIGAANSYIEFPESTSDRLHAIGAELFAVDHVRQNFTYAELRDVIQLAAATAAIARENTAAEQHLRAAYTEIGKNPEPTRMLFRVAPLVHFEDESVTIGDVTLFHASEAALAKRWPNVVAMKDWLKEHALKDIKDRMVAELTVSARPQRAEEIAAERITATLGIVGIAYTQLHRDWPIAGLLPTAGAGHIRERPDGGLSFGPATFFDTRLMSFPSGYLSAYAGRTAPTRLGEIVAGRC